MKKQKDKQNEKDLVRQNSFNSNKTLKRAKEKPGILSGLLLMWHYMGVQEKFKFIAILILSLVGACAQAYGAILPGIIIAWFSGETIPLLSFIDFSAVSTAGFLAIACGIEVVLWALGMLIYRMVDIFARRMMCVVNEKVQNIILMERKNLDFEMTIGEINYICKNAVDNIYNILETFCWNIMTGIIGMVYLTISLFMLGYVVGLVTVGLEIIILVCVYLRIKFQQKVVDNIEETNAKIGNHFLQSLTNLPMITIFESKARELAELKKLNTKFFKDNKKRANIGFLYWTIVISIEYIGLGLLIFAYIKTSASENIIASITNIVSVLMMIYSLVEGWGYIISNLQTSSIKFCNLYKSYPNEIGKNNFSKSTDNNKPFKSLSKAEQAAFDEINESSINKVAVKNLTVKVGSFKKSYEVLFEAGKIYVIAGQSGQGKTTLINAMCGLREIQSGHLLINDKLKLKSLYSLKNHISYLFQDSILFDRSISLNISYPELEMSEKANELATYFDIAKLLERETKGSIASSLSGGEKKRIDIVRTVSKNKDLYLLDEPTNELDAKNVERVLKVINDLKNENKIVILISHDERCKTIADEIIEL